MKYYEESLNKIRLWVCRRQDPKATLCYIPKTYKKKQK